MTLKSLVIEHYRLAAEEKKEMIRKLNARNIPVKDFPSDLIARYRSDDSIRNELKLILPDLEYSENIEQVLSILDGFTYEDPKLRHQEFADLNRELSECGLVVRWLPQDLIGKEKELVCSIPILKKWVFEGQSPGLVEFCMRLLTYPPLKKTSTAKEIFPIVYDERFTSSQRWTMGNTMAFIANDEVYNDLINVIETERFGSSRQMFIVALGNIPRPETINYLAGLLQNPKYFTHAGYTIMALNKLKAIETIELVRAYDECPRKWVAHKAKKTVMKFDKINSNKS